MSIVIIIHFGAVEWGKFQKGGRIALWRNVDIDGVYVFKVQRELLNETYHLRCQKYTAKTDVKVSTYFQYFI